MEKKQENNFKGKHLSVDTFFIGDGRNCQIKVALSFLFRWRIRSWILMNLGLEHNEMPSFAF
jgi:hypothetical protein